MELQEDLKQQAITLGLCQEWTDNWGTPDTDQLCEKFIRGLDFCIKHDFPTVDYIKEHFDADDIEKHGVFVRDGEVCDKRYVVAMGDATVRVVVTTPCEIVALHNATVIVQMASDSLCYISARHNCHIKIEKRLPIGKICLSYWGGEIEGKEYIDKITVKVE